MFIIVNEQGIPQFYGYDEGCPDGDINEYNYLVDDEDNPTEFDTMQEARNAIYYAEMEDMGYLIKEAK